jgi:hypothetical protein
MSAVEKQGKQQRKSRETHQVVHHLIVENKYHYQKQVRVQGKFFM